MNHQTTAKSPISGWAEYHLDGIGVIMRKIELAVQALDDELGELYCLDENSEAVDEAVNDLRDAAHDMLGTLEYRLRSLHKKIEAEWAADDAAAVPSSNHHPATEEQ